MVNLCGSLGSLALGLVTVMQQQTTPVSIAGVSVGAAESSQGTGTAGSFDG